MRELRESRTGKLLGRLYPETGLLHIRRGPVSGLFDTNTGACLSTDPDPYNVAEIIRVHTRPATAEVA